MSIRREFTGPWWVVTTPFDPRVMVAFAFVLLAGYIAGLVIAPSGFGDEDYEVGVVILIGLFNYLDQWARESQFRWPTWLVAAIHILSVVWLIFALSYFLYFSHVLFPRHLPPGN